jgi:hypothetical protein
MVRILNFSLNFDKKYPIYAPNELVSGYVTVRLSEIKTIKLDITLNGVEDIQYLKKNLFFLYLKKIKTF